MKKNYVAPAVEFVSVNSALCTTSGGNDSPGNSDGPSLEDTNEQTSSLEWI